MYARSQSHWWRCQRKSRNGQLTADCCSRSAQSIQRLSPPAVKGYHSRTFRSDGLGRDGRARLPLFPYSNQSFCNGRTTLHRTRSTRGSDRIRIVPHNSVSNTSKIYHLSPAIISGAA